MNQQLLNFSKFTHNCNVRNEDSYLAECSPWLDTVLSECSSESPQVGNDASGDEDISCQVVICALKIFSCLSPSKEMNSVRKDASILSWRKYSCLSDADLVFSPPRPPISFSALSSFLAHRSTWNSSWAFSSVFSWKVFWSAAKRSSTSFSSALFSSSKAMVEARDSCASARFAFLGATA